MEKAENSIKQSRTGKTLLNFWANLIAQLLIFVFGFLLPKVVVNNYGSDTNGLITSINQIFVYAALIEVGIGTAGLNLLYRYVKNQDRASINGCLFRLRRFYQKASIFYVLAVIALSFIYPLLAKTTVDYWTVVFVMLLQGAWSCIPYFTYSPLYVYLQAEGKNYVIIIIDTTSRVLTLILKVVLYSFGVNIVFVQLIALGFAIIKAVAYYVYWKKKYGWLKYDKTIETAPIKGTAYFTISALTKAVIESTDVILISVLISTSAASVYSVYALIFVTLKNAATSFVLGNFIVGQSVNDDPSVYRPIHDSLESFIVTTTSAIFTIGCCLALPFLRLYTSDFTDANYIDPLIPILFAISSIIYFAHSVNGSALSAAGKAKRLAIENIIEVSVNIGLSIPLIFLWGIRGTLLATIIAGLASLADQYFYTNKTLLSRHPWKPLIVLFLNLVLFSIFAVPAYFLDYHSSSYWQWIILALAVTAVVLAVFAVSYVVMCPSEFLLIYRRVRGQSETGNPDLLEASLTKARKGSKRISFPWNPRHSLRKAVLYSLTFAAGFGALALSYATGMTSYQTQFHSKIMSLDEYQAANAKAKEEWFSIDEYQKGGIDFRDAMAWQSDLTRSKTYAQSYCEILSPGETYFALGSGAGSQMGEVSLYVVSAYSDTWVMESISLPLYRNIGRAIEPRGGADIGIYVSETYAQSIVDGDPNIRSFDDILNTLYIVCIDDGAGTVYRASVNNIFLSEKSPLAPDDEYQTAIKGSESYPQYFFARNPNVFFTYSSKIMDKNKTCFHVDCHTSYSHFRNAIRDTVGFDYATRGGSVKTSIGSTEYGLVDVTDNFKFDESAYGENVMSGVKVYLILPAIIVWAAFILFTFVIICSFRGVAIIVFVKSLAVSTWPVALGSIVKWIFGLVMGKPALTPYLWFNVFGNVMALLALASAIVAGLFWMVGQKEKKR